MGVTSRVRAQPNSTIARERLIGLEDAAGDDDGAGGEGPAAIDLRSIAEEARPGKFQGRTDE